MNLLQRSESLALLERLPSPHNVWKYFLMITETPRPSGKLDLFRKKLIDLAPELGCETAVDPVGNVRFRMKAKSGFEDAPKICFQAHLDMVTSANSDVSIDFEKDPINVYLEQREGKEWMLAKGTTLGADNGLGVAAALALFEDAKANKFSHGQLEALFTVDEETTMIGAEQLAPHPFLDSDILLNLDSEEEYAICIGCAGGAENTYTFPIHREAVSNHKQVSFHLKGLLGGHSGVDIHQGRANAIKCLNLLLRLGSNYASKSLLYVSFSATGAPNVIPREAQATVSVPNEHLDAFLEGINKSLKDLQEMYLPVEHRLDDQQNRVSTMNLVIQQVEVEKDLPLTQESTNKVLDFAEGLTNGVIRLDYDVPGGTTVETSTNFANLEILAENVRAHSFTRSSSTVALQYAQQSFESFARISGADVTAPLNFFPGWKPDISSLAVVEMQEAHKEVLNREPRIYSIHAGLECGLLQAVYPEMKCVSVGPEIQGAHSPDERLLVESVKRFYDLVTRFIERIAQRK